MKALKNNELNPQDTKQLCRAHGDIRSSKKKIKLVVHKSYGHAKTYHPLKRKKVNLRKLQFASDTNIINLQKAIKILEITGNSILSKRYCTKKHQEKEWNSKKEIIDWLISIKIDVITLGERGFLIKNKLYSFGEIVLFANRKRREFGFKPFYVNGVTEH